MRAGDVSGFFITPGGLMCSYFDRVTCQTCLGVSAADRGEPFVVGDQTAASGATIFWFQNSVDRTNFARNT